MLHTINPEILFLKQEDVIKAGLLDMKQILAVTEKTYAMLGQGLIKNPPKTNTSIPDKENWQSFFNAMPCYIGGDINIGGIKWAAESKKNATRRCCRSAFWTARSSPRCAPPPSAA